jgi:hypothetical protein
MLMDYGQTTYERRYFHDFLPFRFAGLTTAQPTEGADLYDGFRSALKREPLGTLAYRGDERIYYLNAYGTGGRLAVTLERHLGWETWRRTLATYADRFWFRHPRPADFIGVVNEVSGQDLTWFFDQILGTANLFDYAVDRVVSRKVQAGRAFDSTVDIRRWGEGVFPVGLRVTFEDGSVAEEKWDGRARWTRLHYVKPSMVARVEVDPESVLVLDVNSSNNSWTRRPESPLAATKWTAKWTVWLQGVLELAAFFS